MTANYMTPVLMWMLILPVGAAMLAALHYWRTDHRPHGPR